MTKPIPYTGEESYIFISYSHRNTEAVWEILNSLQREGFRFWYDDGIEPGVSWDDYIAEHINDCGYMVAFISREYSESDNCNQELRYAIEQRRPVLLVRLDEHKMKPGLEMRLCTYQSVNAYENDDADLLEKIMTAEGIGGFKAKNEEAEKRYFFKEKYPRLVKILKQSYYYEAIFQEYELIDNLLFWCLYEMGFLANASSTRIRDCARSILTEEVQPQGGAAGFSIATAENKLQMVESVFRWANAAEADFEAAALNTLKTCLSSGTNAGRLPFFSDVALWCDDIRNATSDAIRKNRRAPSRELAAMATKGQKYARELDKVYKEIRKGSKIRKAFGLK